MFFHPPSTGGTSVEFSLTTAIADIQGGRKNRFKRLYVLTAIAAGRYGKHKIPDEIKKLDPDVWDSYFKFMFVRNPWDRFVSFFHRRMVEEESTVKDFSEFVHSDQFWLLKPQTIWFHKDLNFIGRFESLHEDFLRVCRKVGVNTNRLSHIRTGKPRQLPHYSCYYNEETKGIIADVYREDIDMFGYEFSESYEPPITGLHLVYDSDGFACGFDNLMML